MMSGQLGDKRLGKHTTWEFKNLHDGRYGIFKDGICVHVARSEDEATAWWKAHFTADVSRELQDKMLGRAIGRSH